MHPRTVSRNDERRTDEHAVTFANRFTGAHMRRQMPGRRFHRRNQGQSLVEFALILPILLTIVAGAVDMGRLFFAYVTIENAAREAAFYGAFKPQCDVTGTGCIDPGNVTWRLTQDLSRLS